MPKEEFLASVSQRVSGCNAAVCSFPGDADVCQGGGGCWDQLSWMQPLESCVHRRLSEKVHVLGLGA